ncbi:MAG: hypothetical protein NTV34_20070 [Proteobacteria bacterium]|nr:hypothetical protein [Pseudomonadota bacterium]
MFLKKNLLPQNWYRLSEGRVAPPLILWFFGVPAGFCVVLWALFFRGK